MTPEQRRQRVLENDRHRKRVLACIEREKRKVADSGPVDGWSVAPVRVLVPWHTDAQGCLSRTMGRL